MKKEDTSETPEVSHRSLMAFFVKDGLFFFLEFKDGTNAGSS
jgi:hypothetical protein